MRLAFNTWCYGSFPTWLPSYPLEHVIERLSSFGYDGIEIGCAAPHAWPAYLTRDRRTKIKKLLEDHNLPAVSLLPAPGGGPGFNPASPLAEERQATREQYKAVIDLAGEWGAPVVLYVAGWQVFGTSREDAWRWSAEVLRDVAAHADAAGVTLCVEPTSADSNLVDSAGDALRMMKESEAANVSVMFDTYHALYRNEDPADYPHEMVGHLGHVHISDYDRLPPGRGGYDFRPLIAALEATGYDGPLTMEIGFASRSAHPDALAMQSLEYLRSITKRS